MKLMNFRFVALPLMASFAITVKAELVIIVNPANSNSLTTEQIARIFLGKQGAFPNGEASVPVDIPKGELRDEFYSKVTGKNRGQVNAYWSQQIFTGAGQPPKEVTTEEVVDLVAKNPNIIGYVDKAKANSSVKVVLTVP